MTQVSTIMTVKCLCTNNGMFHCDEIVGAAILQYIYDDITVIRTSDRAVITRHQLSPDSIVLSVGYINDHAQKCYDHSDLIYQHYGHIFIDKYIDEIFEDLDPMESKDLEAIYELFYDRFIKMVDIAEGVTLSVIISNMNYHDQQDDVLQGLAFNRSVKLCQDIMLGYMHKCIHDIRYYAPDRSILEAGVANTPEHIKAVGVLQLSRAINVDQILKELDPAGHYKYVVVARGRDYYIQTVRGMAPLMSDSDANDLYKDKVIFIHKSLTTGAATDKETATDIAVLSAHNFSRKDLESIGTTEFLAQARAAGFQVI